MTDAASGGSDDWVKGVAGVKFAYTVELPDRGDFGFLLPASEILPVGQVKFEYWALALLMNTNVALV